MKIRRWWESKQRTYKTIEPWRGLSRVLKAKDFLIDNYIYFNSNRDYTRRILNFNSLLAYPSFALSSLNGHNRGNVRCVTKHTWRNGFSNNTLRIHLNVLKVLSLGKSALEWFFDTFFHDIPLNSRYCMYRDESFRETKQITEYLSIRNDYRRTSARCIRCVKVFALDSERRKHMLGSILRRHTDDSQVPTFLKSLYVNSLSAHTNR